MSIEIEKQKLIICEGFDDESFYEALLDHLNIDDTQVIAAGSKGGWSPD